MRRMGRVLKNTTIAFAIAGASVWANKKLEAKTYDAEVTQSVAQILDATYGNDTTEIGRKWRIISVKENITANDVYEFLSKYWGAYEVVNDVCPACILGLAEVIRKQNLESKGANGIKIESTGPGKQPEQAQTTQEEVSKEAKDFFSKTIEVEGKKMSALEYLTRCGYTEGEIEGIYRKIKRDWGEEPVRLSTDLLEYYAREVTGRVLIYPDEKKPEPTQAQLDSLRGWAIDTLNRVFEGSLSPAKKHWDLYWRYGDQSLDGLYMFLMDIRTLCGKGTKEEKVVERVIKEIWPYTEEHKRIREEIKNGGNK